ncbi:SDR family NAD(P)-dependent oxidoreductase [Novosphingobium sp. G106]|uniref:SDR family NAD(P)-dependent oxidoreductase n=1 Tax=Novosphingobium sp. G106 TaxID=2849500 RepID=UPI0028122FBA|nr:SDR family NAD(P)-dependent oxidoreductase [Novosphingobium sp. G106]
MTGAGAGLGRAYALELARRGACVVVNDIGGDAADEVAAQITSSGGYAVANSDSVATRAGGRAIVDRAIAEFGKIDILISNAGILRQARFDEMSENDIDDVIDVHLKGAFHAGQPAFAAMKQQGYGRLLFTASSSGLFGHPWQASYAAAKAGIVGLANAVALEGKDHGVLCNVIAPNARTRMADGVDFAWRNEVKEVGAALGKLIALPAGGGERLDPDWTVPLAMYLVSEDCAATHGTYSACSGRYARVAIAVADGWLAPVLPSAEHIADHWPQICDADAVIEPMSVYDEALAVREMLARLA